MTSDNAPYRLLTNTSLFTLGLLLSAAAVPFSAHAQESAGPQAVEETAEPGRSEIVVTGTRIVRDGYEAPTPTTVLGIEELQRAAVVNIADQVNRLPALAGSMTTRTNAGSVSAGYVGVNALNLRGLGQLRTLVLMDGQRLPAATLNGYVDVNTVPNALVKRVDIVTGGASAAWGSDAVAGVVNFVLDKDFTGVKGEVQGGITTYGDDANFKVSLSAGASFADGRGHIMVSGENSYNEGIIGVPRSWYQGRKTLLNPAYTDTNGQPRLLVMNGVGYSNSAPGGIITSGPLKGTYFGPGGVPGQLNYGSIVNDPFMVGGDWQYTDWGDGDQSLSPELSHQSIFGRVSYDVLDNVEVYGQFSYARSHVKSLTSYIFQFGNLTINRDNPYLPASVAAQMDANGLSSVRVGTSNDDLGAGPYESTHGLYRYSVGASGNFDAFGSNWKWDVSAYRNISKIFNNLTNPINARYTEAIDAVISPTTGAVVCRSTLTNPNNGCVPLNIIGTGVATQAAIDYVQTNIMINQTYKQTVIGGTLRGEPFSTWAGPVSVALGYEHRKESGSGTLDPVSLRNGYFQGNYKPINGAFDVDEGFLEVVVPLAKDMRFAHALDFNAAVRGTDYSTSGYVTTWKAGFTYAPIEDIRFRITRSRDIRAGNLNDIFSLGLTGTVTVVDLINNNQNVSVVQSTSGNPLLKPEKADSLNLGVVVQPRIIPGFSASVDYFDIKVKGAIASLNSATTISQCAAGNQSLCANLVRDSSGTLTAVLLRPINLAKQVARGIDFEAGYVLPLETLSSSIPGKITLRALATRYLKSYLDNGINVPDSALGENMSGVPKWRYSFDLGYSDDRFSASVTGRGLSGGVADAAYIECTSSCPTSTADNMTINDNSLAGAFYVDLAAKYKLLEGVETFISVDNVFNKDPAPTVPGTGVGSAQLGVSPLYYDVMGRSFRAGVRFKL